MSLSLTLEPSSGPTSAPSMAPSPAPTSAPSSARSSAPSFAPTIHLTGKPAEKHKDSQVLIDTFQFYGNGLLLVFFVLCLGRRYVPSLFNLRRTTTTENEKPEDQDSSKDSKSQALPHNTSDSSSTPLPLEKEESKPAATTEDPEEKDRYFHRHTPVTERLRSKGLANEPHGFFSWLWKLFQISEDEFVDDCGLDALCFVRVCAMGWKLCCMGMINSIWLMPSYATANDVDVTDIDSDSFYDRIVEITTSNVPPGSLRLTATVVASYLVFGHAMYTILQEFEWFTKQRHLFLQKRLARNYSVYIRNIPEGYQSNQALIQFFQRSMTGIQVQEAHISIKTVKLRGQVAKRENVLMKLEHAVAEYDETQVRPKHKLEKSLQLGMGVNIGLVVPGINLTLLPDAFDRFDVLGIIGGKEVDSINYYAQELLRLNQDIANRIDILKVKAQESPDDVVYRDSSSSSDPDNQEVYQDEEELNNHQYDPEKAPLIGGDPQESLQPQTSWESYHTPEKNYDQQEADLEKAPLIPAETPQQPNSIDLNKYLIPEGSDEDEDDNTDPDQFFDLEKAPLIEEAAQDLPHAQEAQNATGRTEGENSESTSSSNGGNGQLVPASPNGSPQTPRLSRGRLMTRFQSTRTPLGLKTTEALNQFKSTRVVQNSLDLATKGVSQTAKVATTGVKVATSASKLATKGVTQTTKLTTMVATKGVTQTAKLATMGAKVATSGATEILTTGVGTGVNAVSNLVNLVLAEDGEIGSAGFIVFENLSTANAALQMVLHESPYKMEVLEAPDPDDILWLNVGREHRDLQVGRQTSLGLTIALCLFWTIPVSFISSMSNIDKLREQVEVIDKMCTSQPWLVTLFTILAPQLLVLLNAALPIVMEFVAMFEGHISGALVQASVFFKLVPINIIQTFFMTTLTGGVLNELGKIINNPQSFLDLLAKSLPTQSTFFIQFCFIATFSTVLVEGLRLGPLGAGILRKIVGPNLTARERKKFIIGLRPFSEPYDFRTGYYWGQLVLLFMIYFVYSVIAPLVCFVAGFCFMVLAAMFRHHFIYVYSPIRDSGGRVWMNFIQVITILMLIAEVTIAALLSLKKAVVTAPWIIPLIVVTILFYFYIQERHFAVSNHLPMMLCLQQDQKNHHKDPSFAKDAYLQPEMRKREDLPVLSARRLREVKDLMKDTLRNSQRQNEAMLEAGLLQGETSQALKEELAVFLNESLQFSERSGNRSHQGDSKEFQATLQNENGFVPRKMEEVIEEGDEEETADYDIIEEADRFGQKVHSVRSYSSSEDADEFFDATLMEDGGSDQPRNDRSARSERNSSLTDYIPSPMTILEKVMVALADETKNDSDNKDMGL